MHTKHHTPLSFHHNSLSVNQITDTGAEALAEALKLNKTLQTL